MKSYFNLFRWPNILMIILLEYLLKFAVFEQFLAKQGVAFPIEDFYFALLVISSVFIAIAGYLVNDIADIEIDKINRPKRVLSSGILSVAQVKSLQWLFEAAGIIMGAIVAYKLGNISLAGIHLLIIIALRAYANKLKCKGLVGNLTIAFSTAMLPVLIWVFTVFALPTLPETVYDFSYINLITIFYVGFAFWFTLIREIVKDLEDLKGDQKLNCKTLAVRMPLQKLKYALLILNLIAISGILLFQWLLFQHLDDGINTIHPLFTANFISIVIVILFHIIPKLITANSSMDFHKISNTLKIVMIVGILQMLFLLC